MTHNSPPVGGPRSKNAFELPKKTEVESKRAGRILAALRRRYPDACCELEFSNAHELLVATILSAQATDVGVNKATPGLFKRFPTPRSYAGTTPEDVEPYVKTLNFWRNKARAVHATMNRLDQEHGGTVPQTMEQLLELRGVARKTANVVLGNAFGINMGVVVDTHVGRIARRFKLTKHEAPEKVERDLMALFPRPSWCLLSHLFIFHGRRACKARGALCSEDLICRKYCSNAGT